MMKAARFYEPGEPLKIEEVPVPEIGPGEVLVRIAGAGICHSDLHILEGFFPLPYTPITLGHENAGYVEKVGDGVEGLSEGDPVAVFGGWGCGKCSVCIRGEEQLCNILNWCGIGFDGGYAEYLRVPSYRHLVPLKKLDPVQAAPLTDAALTSYRAVKKAREGLQPSGTIVVIGVGGLGQYGVQFAKMTGARVAAVDIDDSKLEIAKSLGADVVVNKRKEDLSSAIDDFTDGRGADRVIDFVGIDETLTDAVSMLGKQGKLILVGLGGGSTPFVWNPLLPPEISYTTVFWGSIPDLHEVISIAESGRLKIQIETVGFDELNETFERMKKGEIKGRAVLKPD
jgi:propanol-preferring alcohol dehydrogenase